MSLLHRNLLAAFVADIEPAVVKLAEAAVAAASPLAGVIATPLIEELGKAAVSAAADHPAAAAPVSPFPVAAPEPAAVAPATPPVVAPPVAAPAPAAPAVAAAPAGEKLLASDVVNAMLQTLLTLQAKL